MIQILTIGNCSANCDWLVPDVRLGTAAMELVLLPETKDYRDRSIHKLRLSTGTDR